jgi:hypothetical protein
MQPLESSLGALTNRVARLEAQNRRLKKAGFLALVFAATLTAMGQGQPNRVIEANEFRLKDTSGKVRAKLWMNDAKEPALILVPETTNEGTAFFAGGKTPRLVIYRADAPEVVQLSADNTNSGLLILEHGEQGFTRLASLSAHDGSSHLTLLRRNAISRLYMTNDGEGPALEIKDNAGFSAILGSSDLVRPVTGRTEKTSAASLSLFGKDNQVLWTAP